MARKSRPAAPGVSSSHAGPAERRRLRQGAGLCAVAAGAALVAACGSQGGGSATGSGGGNSGQTAPANGAVTTRQLNGVGTALVTSSGMTIYTPKTPAETRGNIKCTGSCLSFWFPVTGSSASLGSSGLPGKLGTIHRSDGKTQLTYNGKPLYTFRLDKAAGQAHGNNFSDSFGGTSFTWEVVTASGKAGGAGSPAPTSTYQNGY
jgi:predicted lipoprotein with Yx(FWY)xxD motif